MNCIRGVRWGVRRYYMLETQRRGYNTFGRLCGATNFRVSYIIPRWSQVKHYKGLHEYILHVEVGTWPAHHSVDKLAVLTTYINVIKMYNDYSCIDMMTYHYPIISRPSVHMGRYREGDKKDNDIGLLGLHRVCVSISSR